MKLGKNMKAMLEFVVKYPGWFTFAKDRATVNAVKRLEKLGLVETNKYHQFRKV